MAECHGSQDICRNGAQPWEDGSTLKWFLVRQPGPPTHDASILRAESCALEKIFETARNVGGKTMTLRHLDTVCTIGRAESTKLVPPPEPMELLRQFMGHNEGPRAPVPECGSREREGVR